MVKLVIQWSINSKALKTFQLLCFTVSDEKKIISSFHFISTGS